MTERTVIKQSLMIGDDDSISLNSTQESEAGEERSYVVDRILAEQDDDEGNKYYLILWEGYELLASTWEPAENIEGQATIDDWTDEKMRVTRGLSKEFDVAAFEKEVERLGIAKEARRARRKAKRLRLGLAASFFDSEDEAPVSAVEQHGTNLKIAENPFEVSVEPEILNAVPTPKPAASMSRRSEKEKPLKNTIKTRVRRRTINLPNQGYMSDTSEESRTTENQAEILDANGKGEKHRAVRSRRVRGTLNFISDGESSSSSDRIPPQASETPMQGNHEIEPPSRTGYQGTANRALDAVSTASIGQLGPPTRGPTRGRPSGRARGGRRGHARTQAGNLGFTKPNTDPQIPQRKRSLANAILNAPNTDSSKPTEHFKTPSMVRKAELAARSLADRAPDFQSVGFLSRPSDYGTRSMRKKSHTVREDVETCQSDRVPLMLSEDGEKSASAVETQNEDVALHRTKRPIEAEMSEQTERLDLSKPSARVVNTDHGSPKHFGEVPLGPGTLVQEVASLAAGQLSNPGSLESQGNLPLGNTLTQQSKPIIKINLNEYKSRQKPEFLGDVVAARALFSSREGTPISIGFTDMDKNLRSHWTPILEGLGVLSFNRSCLAQEFQAQKSFLQRKLHASGNIIIGVHGTVILEDLAEQLRPCSGLIFMEKSFCILIFPAKCEEWKFIDSSLDVDHRLRYQIFEPKFPGSIAGQLDNAFAETSMHSLDLTRHYLDTLVELAQNLRYESLLPFHSKGQDVHNFYLFFPKKAANSARYIASWLRSCKSDCRIYTSQKPGSWDLFTNNPIFKSGTIIIHESFLPLISKIPRISSLINGSFHFNFWCMDDGSNINPFCSEFGKTNDLLSYEASMIRLFPHGGAILITPSFLLSQPERTYDLLKWFHRKASSSTPGTWRLVLYNKCREHLLDLAVQMTSARAQFEVNLPREQGRDDTYVVAASQLASKQECMAAFRNYTMIDQLLKKGFMAGIPDYWEEDVPDEYDSPILYADECIGRNDEKGLVNWFAAWTMLHINLHRKFMVVGTTTQKIRPTSSTKTTRQRLLAEKAQAVPAVQKPQATETIGSTVNSKKWNRSTFNEAEECSPKVAPLPTSLSKKPATGALFTTQSLGGFSKSKKSMVDSRSVDSAAIHVSMGHHPEPERNGPNSKELRQGAKTKHGIDETQPQSILEFIAITGRDAGTAKRFLSRHNWDVHTAVQSYWHSTGPSTPQHFPAGDALSNSEAQSAVVDFIAGTHASAQVAERYLHLAEDDVLRAISLYNDSQQYSRSPSGGLLNQERVEERENTDNNGSLKKPEDTNLSPRTLGRSHQQDELGYKSCRLVEDNPQYEGDDMGDSSNGSRYSSILRSPTIEPRRQSVLYNDTVSGSDGDKVKIESDFESTEEWYGRLRKEGQGWEHIYVGGWESCFQKLLIKY